MKFQLSRWSALALVPALIPILGLTCATDPEEIASVETGSEEFRAAGAGLVNSGFEIDDDANLKLDGWGPKDWVNVPYTKETDQPSGKNDSSYKGGAKEDDACPLVGKGSIPNNKSDILHFGAYQEPGEQLGDPGYLNLFWTRVQDPSGTTLIDFEFNQSDELCGSSDNPHKKRTVDDLLLEYRLEQGGAMATIKMRKWTGAVWGPAVDLSVDEAAGTINTSPILEGEDAGLGELDARTFGEASIDLDVVFDPGKCTSFGSAVAKSRSSDAFDSALKDYVSAPGVDITNCGKIIIRKQASPDTSETFGFSHTLLTDPASGNEFSLGDGKEAIFLNVLLNDQKTPQYKVTEDLPGFGYELAGIDCSASSGAVVNLPDVVNRSVTFTIDDETDIVDCTFTNTKPTPLTDILLEVDSKDDGGTSSTITCRQVKPEDQAEEYPVVQTNNLGDGTFTRQGLLPGTYSCDVVITAN
jgi:hypothetical protein